MRASEPVAIRMFFVSSVCVPLSVVTSTLPRPFDRPEARDPVDLVLLHQKLDAFGVFLNDAVLALDHLWGS